jgi:hypothetical protein
MQRRRFKQTSTLDQRLAQDAERLREEAETLVPGQERCSATKSASSRNNQPSQWMADVAEPSCGTSIIAQASSARSLAADS